MSINTLRSLMLTLIISCCSLYADSNDQWQANSGIDVQNQGNYQSSCGPGCNCGCKEGKACTCGEGGCCGSNNNARSNNYDDVPDSGVCDCAPPMLFEEGPDCAIAQEWGLSGVWLPEDPCLYRTMIADPREPTYSVGWRFNDQVFVKNVIDISFDDSLPIYRWCHIFRWGGDLQIDLQGALWAIFDPLHDSSPLLNADYYVGIPICYAFDNWEFRFRVFHISSHIGDEFLLNHPDFDRRNASAEYIDFFASNDLTDEIRLYAGAQYTIAQDDEFKCARFMPQAGTEIRVRCLGYTDYRRQLYGEPFLAMHWRWNSNFKRHVDMTYVLGYEWGKTCGLERKVRLYLQYHDGYSFEGQFCKRATNYLSIRAEYGY